VCMRAAIVIAWFVTLNAASAVAQDGARVWQREPDMLTPRAAHAVAATADAIYVLGGTGSDAKPVLDVDRFDGKTWTRDTSLPSEGLNAPAAAAIGDSIFLIGGFGTTTNRPVTSVRKYDTKRRQWSDAAPLPAPRGGHAAIVMNGRIHVIGGGNAVSTIADHSIYDPQANAWTDGAPLPRSLGSPAAVVLDGKLYAIGGRSGPSDFGDVSVYDPSTRAWTPGVAIDPRGTGGAVAVGRSIYYFGGESQAKSVVLDDVLRLDAGGMRWVTEMRMPTGRNFARTVLFKGRVFVVGGSTTYGRSHASPGSGVVESFGPSY
jgi:N-acetylneuraminic acid mutarotase